MDPHAIEIRLNTLLSSIKASLPDMDFVDVPELISVWEFKVAMEMLCDHFADQYGGACPGDVYAELMTIVNLLGIDPRYCQNLRPG